MSKRSSGQANTLFNYFQSKPGTSTSKNTNNEESEDHNLKSDDCMDTDDEEIQPKKPKRARVINSDSENEEPNTSTIETPSKQRKLETSGLNSFRKNTSNEPAENNEPSEDSESTTTIADYEWIHDKLEFLKPEKIRDANKHLQSHPDYDERTLYVPEDFLKKQTPAMRQWWELKSKYFDTVLFFKVGKFYELYHMDAVTGVKHLGFTYMKGEFAHSGFPEGGYGRMANLLIDLGYKVARVEQTETPEMMQERCKTIKAPTKFDRVVKREICQVSSKGACVYGAQLTGRKQEMSQYLVALAEKAETVCNTGSAFGICFIDTSIGVFYLAAFHDDKQYSRLLAILAERTPCLFLLEKHHVTESTRLVLQRQYIDVKREFLVSGTQFLTASKTQELLASSPYFMDSNGEIQWPDVLQKIKDDPKMELAWRALGACIWYLKDCKLDLQLLSMKKFELYKPIDTIPDENVQRDYMVLDSMALDNLKLLGFGNGMLESVFDYCCTPFGKRLLTQWICRPLCNLVKLTERQSAVKELVESPDALEETRNILLRLPDFERQIAKIHIFGSKLCADLHPDNRAIFYEAKTYSKRKMFDLLTTLRAFENAKEITSIFKGCQSLLLKKLTQNEPNGLFCDTSNIINYFKNAFNQEQAEKDGKIIPQPGIDSEYDAIIDQISDIHKRLKDYLKKQCEYFGCKVTYFGSDKKRFQLEVPESHLRKINGTYKLEGSRKGAKRFTTETTRELLAEMIQAEAEKARVVHDLNRRIFEKFSLEGDIWEKNVQCLKMLDALCSLAVFARKFPEEICLPKIKPFSSKPNINIQRGRHPCYASFSNFVPNDTQLGTDESHGNILLLTGPNMGGKSTLMRQVALITLMAQLGSYVPATYCELSLVDRIFTRLGAQDDIMLGQSTFLVELTEATSILQHATRHSLVLVDELGRGTSTHDGNAIASAYVGKLIQMECRTMFATHYHNLIDKYAGANGIQLGHMACAMENEEDGASSLVFLYTLKPGSCPRSYGFNAARLAKISEDIITYAAQVAANMEKMSLNQVLLKKILTTHSLVDCKKFIKSLR